jgi:hypothetical protein
MPDWIGDNKVLLWWLAAGSVVMFFGTLLAIPWLVVRIPADYFTRRKREPATWWQSHAALRVITLIAKNTVAVLFVAAGLLMLLTPGQGILAIFMGIMLADFPGKFRLERWLVRRGPVLRAMNWIRARAHRPPIQPPPRRQRAVRADRRRTAGAEEA